MKEVFVSGRKRLYSRSWDHGDKLQADSSRFHLYKLEISEDEILRKREDLFEYDVYWAHKSPTILYKDLIIVCP